MRALERTKVSRGWFWVLALAAAPPVALRSIRQPGVMMEMLARRAIGVAEVFVAAARSMCGGL